MTDGERRLCDWQHDRSGGFFTALFELMCRSDSGNLARLAKGFPEEAEAVDKYQHIETYWPALEKEYNEVNAAQQKVDGGQT